MHRAARTRVLMLVYPTEQLVFSSEEARQTHARRYRNFVSALDVWRQIDDADRVYILKDQGYADVDGAIERERAAGYNLSTIKATGARRDRLISAIRFYPRSARQREQYKISKAARLRDLQVRKHERRLREKGLRRPRRNGG